MLNMASAIITGDIVKSRLLSSKDRERLYESLLVFLKNLKKLGLVKKFEAYRGDSFQCEIVQPTYALRTALIIQCFVKAFSLSDGKEKNVFSKAVDVRLSIGIGNIDFIKNKLAISDGEAFVYSGEGLDELKNSYQQLYLKTNNNELNEYWSTIIILLDAVMHKCYPKQAEVIMLKLLDKKEIDIANNFTITQSAVNQRAKSASWYAIENTVKKFETQI